MEEKDQNSNAHKNRARTLICGRIRKNSNVYKKWARITVFSTKDKIIIPVLIEIVLESQGFEGKDQKTNVYKNRARIKVFGRII